MVLVSKKLPIFSSFLGNISVIYNINVTENHCSPKRLARDELPAKKVVLKRLVLDVGPHVWRLKIETRTWPQCASEVRRSGTFRIDCWQGLYFTCATGNFQWKGITMHTKKMAAYRSRIWDFWSEKCTFVPVLKKRRVPNCQISVIFTVVCCSGSWSKCLRGIWPKCPHMQ